MAKLGQAGKADAVDQGEGELPAAVRKPRPAELVAARVADYLKADVPLRVEGVQPLNEGFFLMQRLRSAGGAKERSEAVKLRT